MIVKPIRNDEDHAAALAEIERLWGAPIGSADGDRVDVLATLVAAYEEAHWPIDAHDPVEAIQAAMDMNGYTRAELARLIGASRASEVMSRSRRLTLPMIRKIASAWHVPARLLVQDYALHH